MLEGEAIESRMVSRRIEGAQKKVEERHFETRKNLLEYDEVMDEQRKRVYGFRQNILDGANCKKLILEMIDRQVDHFLGQFLAKDYGTETFAGWAGKELSVELDAGDFRGTDFNAAQDYAKDHAERMIEGQILEAIDENLPDEEDSGEWNWEALAKTVNNRWQLSLRDRDLKRVGREGVAELLIEKAQEALTKVDLSDGTRFLDRDFGIASARGWVLHKFGIELDLAEVGDLELAPFKQLVRSRAEAAYDEKEAEYPVMAGLYHFTKRDSGGHKRYDREALVDWARDRFHVELSIDDLRNKQRDEIRALLIDHSRSNAAEAREANAEAETRLEEFFASAATPEEAIREAENNGQSESLSQWLADRFQYELSPETIAKLQPEQLENHVSAAVEEQYRPEMRRMERSLMLQLLDSAWKEHLLSMDHLRSSVGLRGYAQVDPKVEYKREGMRIFETMWDSVGARTTDLIFRIEQLDEGFVGSTWTQAEARHDEAMSAGEIAAQQEAAIEGTQADHKPEPIRHRQQRVGRNDPCPCGSGKKFKSCCMKKSD